MLQSMKREEGEMMREEGAGGSGTTIILDKTAEFCKQVGGEEREEFKGDMPINVSTS